MAQGNGICVARITPNCAIAERRIPDGAIAAGLIVIITGAEYEIKDAVVAPSLVSLPVVGVPVVPPPAAVSVDMQAAVLPSADPTHCQIHEAPS
jgi:hypothetical protein